MAQNEEKVVLHHEDRRWKFLSIIFIALFILSSIASVFYITNLFTTKNNIISQNILLKQQLTALKEAKQAKDIPQIQFQLLSQMP
jgi:cell division protein FtsL